MSQTHNCPNCQCGMLVGAEWPTRTSGVAVWHCLKCDNEYTYPELVAAMGETITRLEAEARNAAVAQELLDAHDRLCRAAPNLLEELRTLANLAHALNTRQHAGLEISPAIWSDLHQSTHSAQAAIAKATKGA